MLLAASLISILALFTGLLNTAAAQSWDQRCASTDTMCILTASGISVNAPDGGVTNHGVISGTGLTAWELDKNKGFVRGTITGCNGTAVFAFQQGDAYYDATNQGKGRLYAWFRSKHLRKIIIGTLHSRNVGEDLFTICAPPSGKGENDDAREE